MQEDSGDGEKKESFGKEKAWEKQKNLLNPDTKIPKPEAVHFQKG